MPMTKGVPLWPLPGGSPTTEPSSMTAEGEGEGPGVKKTAGGERGEECIELVWSLLQQILFAASAACGGGEPSQLGDPFTKVPMTFSGWPFTFVVRQ